MTRPAAVRYLGFRSTEAGREYSLRIDDEAGTRVFTFVIPHAAFTAREARFQDAPDLCFTILQRELAEGASVAQGEKQLITASDLADYRDAQSRRVPERKRRRPSAGVV